MASEALYQQRADRIEKAIRCEPVDQIPTLFMGQAFAPRWMGLTTAQYCTDPEGACDATLGALVRLGDVDGINLWSVGYHTVNLSTLWLSKVLLPGKDLPDDALWQVVERETMTVDDYDTIARDGWQPFVESFLPKVVDMEMFQAHMDWLVNSYPKQLVKFKAAGYVPIVGGITTIPFEVLCGGRSMNSFFMDLYREPARVKAAIDAMVPAMIENAIAACALSGVPRAWIGGWRSASAMLAPKLWDEFVWPYYYAISMALIDEGITPVLHWDQDWTRDLARLKELPARSCILNPDGMTDVRKAKEILDGHMAIMGDLPAAVLSAGDPDDVSRYVEALVRDVGPEGLLLCPGCDGPIDSKPENFEAFVAAGREFGRVS
jgi:uroporphyrinogen-III decarboxylase